MTEAFVTSKLMSIPDLLHWLRLPTEWPGDDANQRAAADEIERLQAALDEASRESRKGWDAFYKLRSSVAEERYPGMTGIIKLKESAPVETDARRCHCGKYEWPEGVNLIRDDYDHFDGAPCFTEAEAMSDES